MKTSLAATRRLALLLTFVGTAFAASAAPVPLAPELAGQYKDGKGVDATFLKVTDTWAGSGVLYDPVTDQLGIGQPIGNFPGGTGLWGLIDWHTANQAPSLGMIEGSWSGRVGSIAFGDHAYKKDYDLSWGTVDLAPLFGPGSTTSTQENWTSRFSGYIRISEAGVYNFGVLHDDGFFFTLAGAGGQALELSNDYLNPRNRMSFSSNLLLEVGLYGFELGAYEHLEAGVVELSWARNGGDWSRVPMGHLVASGDVTPVPEPASWAMLLPGLLALSLAVMRRRAPPL